MASWESLGGGFNSGLGAASWAPGRLDVFGQGQDAACWHTWWDGSSWAGWESLGGGFTSEIDAVSWDANRIDVFGRGQDNACWHAWWDGSSWSDWESLGGGFNSGISAASWAPGRLDLFGQGTDGACWHKWFDGGWSEWESLGGGFSSEIDAVSWASGRIDVFGRGLDNACWHKWFDGGWSEWESLGGGFTTGIAAASWAPGRLDLFGQGLDTACWHKRWENGWNDWESLGGSFTSPLAAVSWEAGRIDVFGRGTDLACWHTWYANAWADWSAPGGGTVQIPVLDVVGLEAIVLPTFDQTAGSALQSAPVGDVVAADGAHWRTFTGWVEPPADGLKATVLCRKTGLSIRLEATGKAAKLLPFTDGSPTATLSWTSAGQPKTRTMDTAVDVANGTVMLVSAFENLTAYGEMVKVLSDSVSGITVALNYGHRFLVSLPPPPVVDPVPDPDQSPPIVPPHRRPPIFVREGPLREVVRDHRVLKLNRVEPLMAVPQGLVAQPVAAGIRMVDDGDQIERLRNPQLVSKLRLTGRDWGRVVIDPPPRQPGQPQVSENQLLSAFELPVYRPLTDLAVYPDQPRINQEGWDQVPGRPADKPALHFNDSPRPDVFYFLPTAYRLGFYRGTNPNGADDLKPIRITQYLDGQVYRVKVTLVALPYINDGDRESMTTYIREVVLRGMMPFVSLEPRSGLVADFVSDWSAGAGSDQTLLPASITLAKVDAVPDRRLLLTFDMEATYFGIFCELLKKGIRGRVTVKEDDFSESIGVVLRLDKLVTNALKCEAVGFGTVGEIGMAGDATKRSVVVRNGLDFPVSLSSLQVTCIDRGPVPGLVFAAEPLELLTEEKVLKKRDNPKATAAYDVNPQRIAVWNDTLVTMGSVAVDGGDPAAWLEQVTRDSSLEPLRQTIMIIPAGPPDVKVVRLKLLADALAKTPVQDQNIVPGGPSPLVIEMRLTDLLAAGSAPLSYVLEYECEYTDGRSSLSQRVPVTPALQSLALSLLTELPTSVFKVEHGLPGKPTTTDDLLSRDAAADVIEQARTRGELWRVTARPKP